MAKFQSDLPEEVILKDGARRCSGRIRDGKFVYYLPKRLKKEIRESIIVNLREKLKNRLQDAYRFYSIFKNHRSTIQDAEDLKKMAEEIYTQKYPALDFPLLIQFRRQKTVMGTYRKNNNGEVKIYINDFFKNAPEILINYIIAHELSHHHYSGHDKAFYGELSKLCKDHEKKRNLASQYLILKEAQIL
ncbi:MAG: M48 family metallopeptidase [Halanaerobiales bacterium]|nr:M48 family metallopeptidase [Halanaerobiales bacterium]